MNSNKTMLAVPILIIVVGLGWLLSVKEVLPEINWVWILGLAVSGFLMMALNGIDKFTVVTGSFLIICSLFSVARQTERIALDTEVPCLVMVFGALLLVARSRAIPAPTWMLEQGPPNANTNE